MTLRPRRWVAVVCLVPVPFWAWIAATGVSPVGRAAGLVLLMAGLLGAYATRSNRVTYDDHVIEVRDLIRGTRRFRRDRLEVRRQRLVVIPTRWDTILLRLQRPGSSRWVAVAPFVYSRPDRETLVQVLSAPPADPHASTA